MLSRTLWKFQQEESGAGFLYVQKHLNFKYFDFGRSCFQTFIKGLKEEKKKLAVFAQKYKIKHAVKIP